MMRLFILMTAMVLGAVAQADQTTITSCMRIEPTGAKTIATISVYSADDGAGHVIRSLMASSLFISGVEAPANAVNCNRTSCGHDSTDEVVPLNMRLYPHFRHGSDVLSSITVNLSSAIMRDSFTLTNCHQTDHFPTPEEAM